MNTSTALRATMLAIATFAAAPLTHAEVPTAGANADAQARYTQEKARCLSGQSGQELATCLREAGAALQASKTGQLNDRDAAYLRNALERCKPLPADEAKDCRDRIMGEANVNNTGSVKGGGVLREKTTIEVKPVEPAPVVVTPPARIIIVPAAPAPTN